MDPLDIFVLAGLILAGAFLYSSVGHGGASGYLAAMALFGLAPAVMKPTALVLNILVSGIAAWRFVRAGYFSWNIFWPVMLASVPCAFAGGFLTVPDTIYKGIAGLFLLFSAYRLLFHRRGLPDRERPMPIPAALLAGAGIGFMSGLAGVGGGIFLSPLLLLAGWADARKTSGIAAMFVLANSVSGLGGHFVSNMQALPSYVAIFAAAAVLGGLAGSHMGSKRAAKPTILRLLAVVLIIAACKLLLV